MKTKKHPKANLENYSKLFVQLGLVLSLFIAHVLINQKTFEKEIKAYQDIEIKANDFIEDQVQYEIEEKTQPKKRITTPDEIDQVDNDSDVPEVFIEPIDPDEPIGEPTFNEVDEPEEEGPETVPFIVLENAPVFPGCKGNQKEIKACFEKKMGRFIQRKFNSGIASEIGLAPGVKRIMTIFKINQFGKVTDIQIRAPHERLKREALRVIELLPTMEPGKQRGTAVIVNYSLPIVFKVE